MARGWESKSVEAQQADRDEGFHAPLALSPEDAAKVERRRTLGMARLRVESDLGQVLKPAHRAMLEAALRGLDAELAGLDP